MQQVLTIHVQDDVDDRAARILAALGHIGKLPRFMDAIVERRDMWTVLCWLEDDLLAFSGRNRWCGALDGWQLVVGSSPALLENVPEYTGYGEVQAWLVFENRWVLTVIPADIRQHEDTDDVLVWDYDEFIDKCEAIPIATVALADDSAIHLNRKMREFSKLEAML